MAKKHTKLYTSTIEMYEKTIKEMTERGASEQEINMVKDAMESYKVAVEREESASYSKAKTKNIKINDAESLNAVFTPLKTNLFLFVVGHTPLYLPRNVAVNFEGKEIMVTFYESEQFSPFDYLNKNKRFEKVELAFLDESKKIIRVEKFSKVKVKNVHRDAVDYSSDSVLNTYATFKFRKYGVTTCKKEWNISEAEVKDREKEKTVDGGSNQKKHSKKQEAAS